MTSQCLLLSVNCNNSNSEKGLLDCKQVTQYALFLIQYKWMIYFHFHLKCNFRRVESAFYDRKFYLTWFIEEKLAKTFVVVIIFPKSTECIGLLRSYKLNLTLSTSQRYASSLLANLVTKLYSKILRHYGVLFSKSDKLMPCYCGNRIRNIESF